MIKIGFPLSYVAELRKPYFSTFKYLKIYNDFLTKVGYRYNTEALPAGWRFRKEVD